MASTEDPELGGTDKTPTENTAADKYNYQNQIYACIQAGVSIPIISLLILIFSNRWINLLPYIMGMIAGIALYFVIIWARYVSDGGEAFNTNVICGHQDILGFYDFVDWFIELLPGTTSDSKNTEKLAIFGVVTGLVVLFFIFMIVVSFSVNSLFRKDRFFHDKLGVFFFFAGFMTFALAMFSIKTAAYNFENSSGFYNSIAFCPKEPTTTKEYGHTSQN